MRKIFSALIAGLIAVTCLAGCGGESSTTGGGNTDYSDRPVRFEFSYYAGGFGREWLEAVTKDYMDNVNTDVYIKLRSSSSNPTTRGYISAGVGASDLHQIEFDMFDMASSLEDISDVYEMTVYGENVKVKDKISPEMIDFYNEDGKFYQLSMNRNTGWNWVYNGSVLDKVFGENGYTLPRTTNEFLSFGKTLYENGVYLTAGALADTQGGEYLHYAFDTWFAQMLGYEGNAKYFGGYTKNADGEWEFCSETPKMIEDNRAAIEAVYGLSEKLLKKDATLQYLHKESGSMNYKDLDAVFYGGRFKKQDVMPFAFAYIGEWLEREVDVFFEDGTLKNREQGIKAMKMPVISEIISRTPSIRDDATLIKVVDYVDGKGELPSGVTAADAEIIREARNMHTENLCNQLVIPKTAKNKDAVKAFIAYLCSDRAQKIASRAASGSVILPFGYAPTDEDMGFTISEFIKSFRDTSSSTTIIDASKLNNKFVQVTNLSWYYDKLNPSREIAKDIFGGRYTPVSEIYRSTYDNYARTWKTVVGNYESSLNK